MITNNHPARPGPPPAHALRARGKRLTAPRQMILEVVRATDSHPTAALVYERVRRRLPRVSLATVYRNLRMLAAEGFLLERADGAELRFDGNVAAHDHFTCLACGRIYDVPSGAPRRVRERVAATMGFEVQQHRIEFYGRCAACRRRGGSSRTPSRRASSRRSHGRQESQGQ